MSIPAATHCPHPTADSPRPLCRNVRGTPKLAAPGGLITCKACIEKNGGELHRVEPVTQRSPQPVEPTLAEAKHRKVRVTRVTFHEGGHSDGQGSARYEKTTVAFNGSLAAFRIWSDGGGLLTTDKVEFHTRGEWHPETTSFEGFAPIHPGSAFVEFGPAPVPG